MAVLLKKIGTRPCFRIGVRTQEDKGRRAHHAAYGFSPCCRSQTFTPCSLNASGARWYIAFSDPRLRRSFPNFPAYGKPSPSSSLDYTLQAPDYRTLDQEGRVPTGRWSPAHQIQDEDYSRLRKSKPGANSLLEQLGYSKFGYVVLGLIVAKASGASYPDFSSGAYSTLAHSRTTRALPREEVRNSPPRLGTAVSGKTHSFPIKLYFPKSW